MRPALLSILHSRRDSLTTHTGQDNRKRRSHQPTMLTNKDSSSKDSSS